LRGLGVPLAGRRVTLIGYGHVGQGLARIFSTLGARLTVVDIRAEARLLAVLAGYETDVLPAALSSADVVITATGRPSIITAAALESARDDVILGNVSNCATEIDRTGCQYLGSAGPSLEALRAPSGRRFLLLAGGIQLNHVFEQGNPAELMDLSFSLHALTLEWLANAAPAPAVYPVPPSITERAAALCLDRSI
jgi:adenosylhomocysteinase